MMSRQQNAMERARDRMASVEQHAQALAPHCPWAATVKQLRMAAAKNQKGVSYHILASILDQNMQKVDCGSDDAGSIFLQLVLYHAAIDIVDGTFISHIPIPESIRELLHNEARRIIRDFSDRSATPYRTDSDLFGKDVAIVTGRMLPVGAELIELHSGIPRSVLVRGNFRQFVRGGIYFIGQRRGFYGYCALHMNSRHLEDFNPEGWRKTYLRLAELLELNPEIRGVSGSAWFYDPAVAEISSHLAYLRVVREAGGARNFRYGPSSEAKKDALLKSRKRRLFHEQGRYNPEAYFLIWHRRELLRWANQQRSNTGT